jgi:general secretion pathway protein L
VLPRALTLHAPAYSPRVALAFNETYIVVIDERGGRRQQPAARVARDGGTHENLNEALARLGAASGQVPISLRLPLTDCFERKAIYPLAAQSRLRDIFEMELGRAVLFTRETAYCDFAVTDIDYATRQIHVRQLFARRDKVDAAISELARFGITASFVDVADSGSDNPIAVNLLTPPLSAGSRQGATWSLSRVAGLGLLALALLAVFQTLRRQEVGLAHLTAQAEQSRAHAMEVRKQLQSVSDAESRLTGLSARKAQSVTLSQVWEEVTVLLPDTAWLNELRISGDTIQISGFAASSAGLIPLLERSSLFTTPRLAAAVTFDQREKKETFVIEMKTRARRGAQMSKLEERS